MLEQIVLALLTLIGFFRIVRGIRRERWLSGRFGLDSLSFSGWDDVFEFSRLISFLPMKRRRRACVCYVRRAPSFPDEHFLSESARKTTTSSYPRLR